MLLYRVSLKYEITEAQIVIKTTPGEFKVETEKNGFEMKSHPIKVDIDNTPFYESLDIKSVDKMLKDYVELGKQAVLKAMKECGQDANQMFGPKGLTVAQLAAQHSFKSIDSTIEVIPKKPNISWNDGYIDIKYIKDERNTEWIPPEIEIEYIPYSVDVNAEKWTEEQEIPEFILERD